jgi:phosphatidylglycerol:prolipoprotein diacylglycerol transferase
VAHHEGLSVIWGIGGVALGAFLACRRYEVYLLRALDRAVAPLFLAQALARWGCFAHGCCGGKPTDSWFAVDMPDEYGVWAHRYPTQALSSALNFTFFLTLILVERYARTRAKREGLDHLWPFDGFLVSLYFRFFGLKRFFVAFLRESATPLWGWLSLMHLQAIAFLFIGGGLFFFQWRRQKAFLSVSSR